MIHGLNHVTVRAPRPLLDQVKDFYCDVLGLVVGPRPPFGGFGWWLYPAGSDRAAVHLFEQSSDDSRTLDGVNTFDHFAFDASGRADVEALLAERGIGFRRSNVPERTTIQVFCEDPAGNTVELVFENAES
jgi:catechol 2,3-dioxygenase-like lactoylglutathione lyase family enzyme